jgi:hypothetical protein
MKGGYKEEVKSSSRSSPATLAKSFGEMNSHNNLEGMTLKNFKTPD